MFISTMKNQIKNKKIKKYIYELIKHELENYVGYNHLEYKKGSAVYSKL